jgi:acetyl-CoA acetyltransferase
MMADVYILGSYSTRFGKHVDRTYPDLVREAYCGAMQDAAIDASDIGFAYFGSCFMHLWGQDLIRGQASFMPLIQEGLFPERVPIINVEGACATGSMAFHSAWKDIKSGQSSVVLALGAEKLVVPNAQESVRKAFDGGFDTFARDEWQSEYAQLAARSGTTFVPGAERPITMDTYAVQAAFHMTRYGTTQRQLAYSAAKNHRHAVNNPKAQYRHAMSVEEVLADRPVAGPLTRAMCAPMSDGAAALILCSAEYLKKHVSDGARRRAVAIRASAFSGGKRKTPEEPSLSRVAALRAYAMAGVDPQDIDLVELHDAVSFSEIYQLEMLGMCPDGMGGQMVESGATELGGCLPVNVSGGLVSKGHPLAATGLSMLDELVLQLRGEAGPRQVAKARLGLQENGGGLVGFEEGACSVTILEREEA